jgi:hypothetical protein
MATPVGPCRQTGSSPFRTASALEHARKALAQAPDALNRQSLEAMVAALEAGRPIAQ